MSGDEQRDRLIDLLVMTPMSDFVGTDLAPVIRSADAILRSAWLDRVKREAATDALEEAADRFVMSDALYNKLRNRAAAIREGAAS